MKGEIVLEYPFKIFLYLVVAIVVIGLVVGFRNQILQFFNLCQFIPQGCQRERCSVRLTKEADISKDLLEKYCRLCWDETGKNDYKEDCLCFVVSGKFHPIEFSQENCELICNKDSTSIQFIYYHLLKKIYIKC